MTLIFEILSFIIVCFVIFPYLNSFAYTTKNLLIHGFFGLLLVFLHTKLGFVSVIDNMGYLLIIGAFLMLSTKEMKKKNPDMIDQNGHLAVKRATILFLITYLLGYILLNVKLG